MLNYNTVEKIINLANTKKENYNILTFPTHERYESQLCKTGHNFYSFSMPNLKKWNKKQTEVPSNYYILPEQSVCDYINYDFILVQSKYWQYQVAQQINQNLRLPVICLEHTLPTPQTLSTKHIEAMKHMLGDFNVFISDYSRKAWEINYNTTIIHHGLDTDTFKNTDKERKDHVLTVANDFINRDYCLNYSGWSRVTSGLNIKVIGDNPGLSEPAPSIDSLVDEYNSCSVYFNSTTLSPIPTTLLEAMACGCAVVSTATCMIPEVIENGVNGFISNDENQLRTYIELVLSDEELRNKLGNAARQTIVEKFSQDVFINKWNKLFDTVYEVSSQ